MHVMLERGYTNCINFEHTLLLSEPYVEHLLARHGFRLERKEHFLDDHSVFYRARRDPSVRAADLPEGLYERYAHLYRRYVDSHLELAAQLNARIEATKEPVYLFGAHVFAQYMLAFGLDGTRLAGILDNDQNKQGKRLYGTNLAVQLPSVLAQHDRPIVILRAGVYNEEIRVGIATKVNANTVFLS
jgi:hypothetical protein